MTDQINPTGGMRTGPDELDVTRLINMPLFPLRTVLFPGGTLPLRIFEPRYVDMVRWCMRESRAFGVVLLEDGPDVLDVKDTGDRSKTPHIYDVGTEAHIVDFNQADNGLLGIVARGGDKFSVLSTSVEADGLLAPTFARCMSPQTLPNSYETLTNAQRSSVTPADKRARSPGRLVRGSSVSIGWIFCPLRQS